MTLSDLIAAAREGRADEQALVWLAGAVLILMDCASTGFMRARTGETPTLKLDDKEPIS